MSLLALAVGGSTGAGADATESFGYLVKKEPGTTRGEPWRTMRGGGLVLHGQLNVQPHAGGANFTFADGSVRATVTLPPSVAPAHHRSWHAGDDRPAEVLGGTLETDRDGRTVVRDIRVLLRLQPSAAPADDRATVTVEVAPDDGRQACTSHTGCASTGTVVYDPGDGGEPVAMLLPAVQKVCSECRRGG